MYSNKGKVCTVMIKTGIFPAIIIMAHQASSLGKPELSDRVLHYIEPHGKRNTHLQLLQVFPGDNQNIVPTSVCAPSSSNPVVMMIKIRWDPSNRCMAIIALGWDTGSSMIWILGAGIVSLVAVDT